jgi:hypothetical protein
VLTLGQKGVQKARRAGVVHRTSRAPFEQTAMLEEHVYQLPEHVIQRFDQLLSNERVVSRRLELPFGAGGGECERQTAALARERHRPRGLTAILISAECDRDVVGLGDQVDLALERAAFAREADRGQRTLADDHRMHELDRDVPYV